MPHVNMHRAFFVSNIGLAGWPLVCEAAFADGIETSTAL